MRSRSALGVSGSPPTPAVRLPVVLPSVARLPVVLLLTVALFSARADAQTFPLLDEETAPGKAGRVVAARVGDEVVYVDEVEATLAAATRGRQLPPQAIARLQAQALEQLVGRRLTAGYFRRTSAEASSAEVEQALTELRAQLATQQRTLDELLRAQRISESELRARIAWELTWKKYVARHVTDKELQAYFDANRREFDGTEVAASHILLRPPRSGDTAGLGIELARAAQLRAMIEEKKMTFAEAARRFSSAPSRTRGGAVGYFPRRGIMAEAFSKAAFNLEVGQISAPVLTRFGVHLITTTDVRPGDKPWTESRALLQAPTAKALFKRLADEERKQTPVEYTGAVPHFKPGTEEIVP